MKTTRLYDKLDYLRLGPFIISNRINDVAFHLVTPPHMHIHPVFHVSLLEPYMDSSIPDWVVLHPPTVQLVDGPEFEFNAILDSTIMCKKISYLMDWLRYKPNDHTWEPDENLDNSFGLMAECHFQYPDKSSPKFIHYNSWNLSSKERDGVMST